MSGESWELKSAGLKVAKVRALCNRSPVSTRLLIPPLPEYQSIQTVQATMILSTILCCVAFFVFILQLFRLKQGERFVLTSIIQLLSCLCVMIGASVYTNRRSELHRGLLYEGLEVESGRFGYSYVLAWVAFAFTLLSGLMYLVLRKRK